MDDGINSSHYNSSNSSQSNSNTAFSNVLVFCWISNNHADLLTWIIVSIFVPSALIALPDLFCLLKRNHIAPMYVANLLISDVVQIFCLTLKAASRLHFSSISFVYNSAVIASVLFMTCISLERYLLVAQPVLYGFLRNVGINMIISLSVWVVSFFIARTDFFLGGIIFLPFPLLILCLTGTLKALPESQSVPFESKGQTLAFLALMLLTYSLIYVPRFMMEVLLWFYFDSVTKNNLFSASCTLIQMNPLPDLLLYFAFRQSQLEFHCFKWMFIQNSIGPKKANCITTCAQSVPERSDENKTSSEV